MPIDAATIDVSSRSSAAARVLALGAAADASHSGRSASRADRTRRRGSPATARSSRSRGARRLDGKTDVFVAVSRDGGATFGAPVQVNTSPARRGSAASCRRAWRSSPATRIVESGDRRALDRAGRRHRDQDGTIATTAAGRSTPPVTLQAADARRRSRLAGADARPPRARAHAIWLDHRGLARRHGGRRQPRTTTSAAPHTTASRWRRSLACTTPRHGRTASARARAGAGRLLLLQDGARRRARRLGVRRVASRVPGQHPRHRLHVLARRRPVVLRAVRVSEDGWAINGCPDDGPAMAVDRAGTVHIVWPTVIGGAKPRARSSTPRRGMAARSRRARVSRRSAAPRPAHPQIVVDGGGRVVVAWDESVDGQRVAPPARVKARSGPGAGLRPPHRRSPPTDPPCIPSWRPRPLGLWPSGQPADLPRWSAPAQLPSPEGLGVKGSDPSIPIPGVDPTNGPLTATTVLHIVCDTQYVPHSNSLRRPR